MSLNNFMISVIMPCFNRIDFLDQAINSILKQTYKHFEFIIVDDCSNKETIELLKRYRDSDNRIKLYYNKKNKGPTYTFNKGLFFAKNRFIARMDSDDISHPQRLEKQINFLINNPNIFVVGTAFNIINNNNQVVNTIQLKVNRKEIIESLKYSNPLVNSTFMANINVQKKKFLYLKKVFYPADDYYCWSNIIYNNLNLTNIPDILQNYRVHKSESVMNSRVQGLKTLMIQKFFLLKKKSLNINIECYNSINGIKSYFNKLPNCVKPSLIEILYYEFNDTNEFLREKKWLIRIFKHLFFVKSINDIILLYRFFERVFYCYFFMNKS